MSGNLANIEAKLQTALVLHEQGQLDAAEQSYQDILSSTPDHLLVLINLSRLSLMKGHWPVAETYLNRAIALEAANADLHYQLGIACQQQGKWEQAASCYQRALAFKSNHPNAYANLGILYQQQERLEEAIHCYQQALNINPNLAEVHANLGFALTGKELYEEAIAACQQAISLKPDFPAAYINLGCIYHAQNALDEAVMAYQAAIKLNPAVPTSYHNLGLVLHHQGQLTEAMVCHQQALALHADYAEAHFSLAVLQLLTDDYQSGWREYEWRIAAKKNMHVMPSTWARWHGALGDRAETHELILVEEQGIGDILQFLRYGKLLKKKFPIVSLAVREPLIRLIEMTCIFDQVYPLPLILPEEQKAQYAYLLSIPGLLGVTRNEPLITAPYLNVDPILAQVWADKIRASGSFTVGLNWQGDPATEKTEFKGRSFPLSEFAPLATIPGLQFVSLQKGFGSEQLEHCAFRERFVPCQSEINETWEWTETAAIINSCDLIISSDTSIAHLAGGLGKTAWVLLKQTPDWRWGLEGETCAWYPSTRLFRQQEADNWIAVMQQVRAELMRLTQSHEER